MNFYIEKIVAKGSGKEDSIIELTPGLNIIQGYSNSGKTCVIKCIDYCFGSKNKPFDDSFGYDTIEMHVHSEKGDIQISRTFGKNQVEIITTVPGYDNGTYELKPNPKKKHPLPILSDLLLNAIGIEESHDIIKNKNFDRRHLTWRTFLSLLLFKTLDIAKETSVIEPEQGTERTAFYSALLFLISGNDFKDLDAKAEGKLKKAKKQAVEEYVNRKISSTAEYKKKLEGDLSAFDGIDVEQEMQNVGESLKQTEDEISNYVEKSQGLAQQILTLRDRLAECELLKSRYASLRSQYASDIKRLGFIANGEVQRKKLPVNQTCPFCNGKLPARDQKSYIDSAKAELNRITGQLDGLSQTEQDVLSEQEEISVQLKKLTTEQERIQKLIDEKLQPKADSFQQSLNAYRAYIQTKKELEVVGQFASSWVTDLQQLPDDDESTPEFHPKDHFGDEFRQAIDDLLDSALKESNYENLTASRFNMSDFDVEVNGHKKSSINGQGYCSYLNSIVAMVFREYLHDHAKYDPGFLIIDTPLLGLDQGVDDAAPESMRKGLFQFFLNHQDKGQVIILENLEHVPHLDYEGSGANLITFTKGRSEGRYGFLNDVR